MKRANLQGKRFGYLTVQEWVGDTWKCLCVCGKTVYLKSGQLISGNNKSCGCMKGRLLSEKAKNRSVVTVGQHYGKWTVIAKADPDSRGRAMWLCRCVCGTERPVKASNLVSGKSSSCGCSRKSRPSSVINEGDRFGLLVVIDSNAGRTKHQKRIVRVKCDCGNEKEVQAASLLNGRTRSCGCFKSNLLRQRNTSHGLSEHPLYAKWRDMVNRCYNRQSPSYKYYGERGIGVCREWRLSPATFIAWAEANGGLNPDLEIDRIDNDGDYSPENCRFVTHRENMANRGVASKYGTGIRRMPYGKFVAWTRINGKYHHIGSFATAEEARQARRVFLEINKNKH